MRQTLSLAKSYPTSLHREDLQWLVDAVPDFFKTDFINNTLNIRFEQHDITLPGELPLDHYDLCFADFVLHHIWYDEGGPMESTLTELAIGEMVRLARPGGLIAIREIEAMTGRAALDFRTLFAKYPLHKVLDEAERLQDGQVVTLVYSKTIRPFVIEGTA